MKTREIYRTIGLGAVLLWLVACGSAATSLGGDTSGVDGSGSSATIDGVPAPDTAETPDATVVQSDDTAETPDRVTRLGDVTTGLGDVTTTAKPIDQVLTCGKPASAGGLSEGKQPDKLRRHDIDLARFPNALCNDGTGAVFFYRPYVGEANRNRWVIQLQGGGSCHSADSCARRWCSIETNFGMTQMSNRLTPKNGIDGQGILARRGDNPLGNYNHVYIHYCSSDSWSGTRGPIDVTVADPAGQKGEVTFQLQFNGRRIVDAVIATLRRDDTPPLLYDNGELPDLDDAEFVLFAGASAGGGGVINNADHVREILESHNGGCQNGSGCALRVVALIDSSFGPDDAGLDMSTTTLCNEQQICDYETLMKVELSQGSVPLWAPDTDKSCWEWHAAHAPETSWQCVDGNHKLLHHVTTPFFVRMGLTDSLISGNYIEAGFSVPGQGPLTLKLFAQLVRQQLLALPTIRQTAEEGDLMPVAPGVFGPPCSRHETLSSTPDTFDVTLQSDGTPYTMLDTLFAWLSGQEPAALVTDGLKSFTCP